MNNVGHTFHSNNDIQFLFICNKSLKLTCLKILEVHKALKINTIHFVNVQINFNFFKYVDSLSYTKTPYITPLQVEMK